MGNKTSKPTVMSAVTPPSAGVSVAVLKVASPSPSVPVVAQTSSLAPTSLAALVRSRPPLALPEALPGFVSFGGPNVTNNFSISPGTTHKDVDYSTQGYTKMSLGTGITAVIAKDNGVTTLVGPLTQDTPDGKWTITLTNTSSTPLPPAQPAVVPPQIAATTLPPLSVLGAQSTAPLIMATTGPAVPTVANTVVAPDIKPFLQRFAQILVNSKFALLREQGTDRLYATSLPLGGAPLRFLNGYLSNVALSDFYILGVNRDNSIFAADCSGGFENIKFYNVPGGALQVAVVDKAMWVVNSAGEIFTCPDGCKTGQWSKIPGTALDIGTDLKGNVVVRGTDNAMYVCNSPCTGTWVKTLRND